MLQHEKTGYLTMNGEWDLDWEAMVTAHALVDRKDMALDAFRAVVLEDLFFRWIEIVQYESTQPGGFGPERQVDAAKKIRDLFSNEGIDFDEFWKESVGEDAEASF
ncbi:Ribonucleoside-diphosphate reductase large chain [Verticillium dahliae VDG2]|nr:Ribonucleoside-diphosphate reductase large chain [Verticillium dahliae VDG2]